MGAGAGRLEADCTDFLRRAVARGIPGYDQMPQAAQALVALAWVERHGHPLPRST